MFQVIKVSKEVFILKFLLDPSPKNLRSTIDKDSRLLSSTQNKGPTPPSPKPLTTDLRKTPFNNTNERDSTDPIYGNVQVSQRNKKKEIRIEDEGDLIEHEILNLVEEEQQRDIPPALPVKKRAQTITTITTTKEDNHNNNLDVNIEPTTKLIHPGKNDYLFFEN